MRTLSQMKDCRPKRYQDLVDKFSRDLGVCAKSVLQGAREREYLEVRWLAFQELRAQGYTYSAIERASGYDRTTVYWWANKPRPQMSKRFLEANPHRASEKSVANNQMQA